MSAAGRRAPALDTRLEGDFRRLRNNLQAESHRVFFDMLEAVIDPLLQLFSRIAFAAQRTSHARAQRTRRGLEA